MFPDKKKHLQMLYTIWLRVENEVRQLCLRLGKYKRLMFSKDAQIFGLPGTLNL